MFFSGNLNLCNFFKILQDFEGQGRAEKLSRVIITLFGIVGLIWGGIVQQFSQTIFILAAGVLLSLIVSFFNFQFIRDEFIQNCMKTGLFKF